MAAHTTEGHQGHNTPSLFYNIFLSLFSLFPDKISLAPFNGLSLPRGQLAIWAIDLANFSSILLLKRPFHDITGRTMANPAPTTTDAVGSSPADPESREAATRPQNAPLATTATAGHHGPRMSPAGGGGVGEDWRGK